MQIQVTNATLEVEQMQLVFYQKKGEFPHLSESI